MNVFIHDEFDPETLAMLQAFYSRSHQSIQDRIDLLGEDKTKIKSALKKYYVGYGHKSIGDCGYTTIFIEGVSLLAAKAVQDFSLYNGQESSTRFIDFQQAEFYHVMEDISSKTIYDNWMNFYKKNFEVVLNYYKENFKNEADDPETFEKALKAKVFDILRGFLPCGTKTQLSWTVNLRQAEDQLMRLKTHPLEEVRQLATAIKRELIINYPNSFTNDFDTLKFNYLSKFYEKFAYTSKKTIGDFQYCSSINFPALRKEADYWLINRPRNTELPNYFDSYGEFMFNFKLDFGSFRDLQRHRNGSCPMPLVSEKNTFSIWYLQQLPFDVKVEAINLINNQLKLIKNFSKFYPRSDEELQYYYPLGWEVDVEYVAALPQIVYVTELRSSKTVHPTLRVIAQKMARSLKNELPDMALYTDFDEVDLCMRRGSQDIIKLSN